MAKAAKVLAVLIVFLALAFGLLIWQLKPIVNRVTPELNRRLSSAIGHDVQLNDVSISLLPTTGLTVNGISLGDKNSPNEATIDSLTLETSLRSLLEKKIEVTEVAVQGGRIPIVRQVDDTFLIGPIQLPKQPVQTKPEDVTEKQKTGSTETEQSKQQAVGFAVKKARLRNFALELLDKKAAPPQAVSLKVKDLEATDLTAAGGAKVHANAELSGAMNAKLYVNAASEGKKTEAPFPSLTSTLTLSEIELPSLISLLKAYGVDTKALQLANEATIRLEAKSSGSDALKFEGLVDASNGAISWNGVFNKAAQTPFSLSGTGAVTITGMVSAEKLALLIGPASVNLPFSFDPKTRVLKGRLHIPSLVLADLRPFLPPLALLQPQGVLQSDITLSITPPQSSDSKSFPEMTGFLKLAEGRIVVPSLPPVILESINADAKFLGKRVSLEPLDLKVFNGKLNAQASVSADSPLTFRTTGSGFSLAEISSAFLKESALSASGVISSLAVQGKFTPAQVKESLETSFNVTAENGSVQGLNVLGETFKQIAQLPLIGQTIDAIVPPKYRSLITGTSTAFDRVVVAGFFAAGTTRLDQIVLSNGLYAIEGDGTVANSGQFNIRAKLKLSGQFVQELVQHQPKLSLLANEVGQLEIPLLIKKEGKVPLVLPDLSAIGKRAVTNTAKEAAKKAADKVAPGVGKAIESLFK